MVSIEKVKNGFIRFIDTDIMPKLPWGKQVGLGIYVGLAAEVIGKLPEQYKDHPAIAMLEVFDDAGNVDIDRIYNAAAPYFEGEKHTIPIPLIADLKVDRQDLDRLYDMILN